MKKALLLLTVWTGSVFSLHAQQKKDRTPNADSAKKQTGDVLYYTDTALYTEKIKNGLPGSLAKNFIAMDLKEKAISLTDFRGRYVLLDFWANCFVPCSKGNPHLIELYQKYHSKGLEVIGIADEDAKPDAWKKAVEKNGTGLWVQVLRGYNKSAKEDAEKDIYKKFGIIMIGTKILIDPNGVIIGRYASEEDKELDKKLETAFK